MAALDAYHWPVPDPIELHAQLGRQAKHLSETTDYALVGSAVIGGGIFEQPARTMGLPNFLMALVSEPAFADAMMDRITDIYIESCNRYLDHVGQYIQVFTFWDDVCGQTGWMIKPDVYVKMVKPKQRRLVEAIKKKTEAKLFYHGCGAAYDLIPHLIEIGFDIVNPVQVSARGMDTRGLKQRYGKDIVFWGGGVDSQQRAPLWDAVTGAPTRSSAALTTLRPAAVSCSTTFTTSRLRPTGEHRRDFRHGPRIWLVWERTGSDASMNAACLREE